MNSDIFVEGPEANEEFYKGPPVDCTEIYTILYICTYIYMIDSNEMGMATITPQQQQQLLS